MRRLTAIQRRLHDETGGMAILVGVLIVVVFMGFTAVVIDSGATFQERRELQNGADAGAFAIAYACAREDADCGSPDSLAAELANANASDQFAEVTDVDLDLANEQVTVDTQSLAPDGTNTFVQQLTGLFGFDSTTVVASATASWAENPSALETLPFAISACEFDLYIDAAGGIDDAFESETVIEMRVVGLGEGPSEEECEAPAGGVILEDGERLEGGFRWLVSEGDCDVNTEVDGWVGSDNGASLPNGCKDALEDLVTADPVALPMFDDILESPSDCASVGVSYNRCYHIYDYTGFKVTGIKTSGGVKAPNSFNCDDGPHCIQGYFTETESEGPPGGVGVGGVSTVRMID